MFADGSNGSVELFNDHIVIRRKGIANLITQGFQGDKTIPLKSITAVQFRPAGAFMGGLVQFTIAGGREFRGGMLEATKDENAVIFERKQESAFLDLRDAIQTAIAGASTLAIGARSNLTDELSKLVELVEKGYLTRDEYNARKNEILQPTVPRSVAPASPQSSIRSRVNSMPTVEPVAQPRPIKPKLRPILIVALIIVAAFIYLST